MPVKQQNRVAANKSMKETVEAHTRTHTHSIWNKAEKREMWGKREK